MNVIMWFLAVIVCGIAGGCIAVVIIILYQIFRKVGYFGKDDS